MNQAFANTLVLGSRTDGLSVFNYLESSQFELIIIFSTNQFCFLYLNDLSLFKQYLCPSNSDHIS
jgi:hypothetical protein